MEKKVLFIATVQSHIINFHMPYINYFKNIGYEVHVLTKVKKSKTMDRVVWENVNFSRNPFSYKNIIALFATIKYLINNDFSLIHVHTPIAACIGRIAAKIVGAKPVIYTAHGFHFYKGAPKINWLIYYPVEKVLSYFTDGIITMNKEDYKLATKKLKPRRKDSIFFVNGVGVCIENYNSTKSNKEDFGLNKNDFIITVVAEINSNKNQMQIIKAVKELLDEHNNIKLMIVGDGKKYNQIQKYITENKLENNIILTGYRNDIPNILKISDIVGLFSKREGLPKSLLEAMSAKKPIIATDIRGHRDLIEDSVNGYLVPINNINKTKEAILKIYSNNNKKKQMGKNGYQKVKSYSKDNVLDQMKSIYELYIN